ncbi:MAG: GtrA family protein [Spirochaetes bacterium]|uniref:GtrA family protein n=1 Tax=Candidatus Ornithospirochaeta stercoripullorum TaxID=2840899 RepID=A0A9D9H5R9_9SPIO|nr:GtrA family protein [Candidatus Ornithospirochaeta stercoripullorum]
MKLHKDFFIYCIFGALATLVNMLSYELLYAKLGIANTLSVMLSWFLAVTFAFFTNKFIVFRVKGKKEKHSILSQLLSFYLLRAGSGLLDVIIMFIAVDVMDWNHTLWKFISNLVMGLCNYIAGKLFIFSKAE